MDVFKKGFIASKDQCVNISAQKSTQPNNDISNLIGQHDKRMVYKSRVANIKLISVVILGQALRQYRVTILDTAYLEGDRVNQQRQLLVKFVDTYKNRINPQLGRDSAKPFRSNHCCHPFYTFTL